MLAIIYYQEAQAGVLSNLSASGNALQSGGTPSCVYAYCVLEHMAQRQSPTRHSWAMKEEMDQMPLKSATGLASASSLTRPDAAC